MELGKYGMGANPQELVPENDLQELWVLAGRVKAVIDYITAHYQPEVDVIYTMLGGNFDKKEGGIHEK